MNSETAEVRAASEDPSVKDAGQNGASLSSEEQPAFAIAQGVTRELGDLPMNTIVTEGGLARIFGRHQVSIKRAVQRGELPPPTRLLGEPVWTVGSIVRHLEERLEEAKQAERKFQKLRP